MNELKRLIEKRGISLGSGQADQLLGFLALLEKWNSRINLTASTEWSKIGPLFEEGIWASELYRPDAVAHLDIGSGGGFPAIILRILNPQIKLDLVESREKKCIFLETLVSALNLSGSSVNCVKLKTFLLGHSGNWDCISWKGIRLNGEDLADLCAHSHLLTQFWMFHGRSMAAHDPESVDHYLKLIRSERFESRREWALSIYCPSTVFHVKH